MISSAEFPLRFERRSLPECPPPATLGVFGPALRQIQTPPEHAVALFADMVQADRNLAIANLALMFRNIASPPRPNASPVWGSPYHRLPKQGPAPIPPSCALPNRSQMGHPIPRALPDELLQGLHVSISRSRLPMARWTCAHHSARVHERKPHPNAFARSCPPAPANPSRIVPSRFRQRLDLGIRHARDISALLCPMSTT